MVLWNNDTIVARYPKIRNEQAIEGDSRLYSPASEIEE
jgi:hypothetical protein